jgi:dTDP-glucose 4,6-dehydratase
MATGIDAVVHFAAESHVDRSIIDSTAFVRTNVMGTQTLLDAARRNGIRRFLHVSTDEVYGSLGPTGYFSETTPLAPNSPYASSKAASDLMVRAAHVTHGMPCIITRCSNNYGPFQFPEKLIPLLITNAREGKPLPIYGDGLYVRDWIHVLDHCAALATVLHQGREGGVYNIGGRNEWPNIQIARKILRLMDRPESLLTYVKDRPGHDRRYAIDCSYIERELGWRPSVDFETGLQQTVQWYLDHPEWVAQVKSGASQGYYRAMYEERDKTLGGL